MNNFEKFYVLIGGVPQKPTLCMRDYYDPNATCETYAYIMWHQFVVEGKKPGIYKKVDGKFVPIQMGRHLMKGVAADGVSLIPEYERKKMAEEDKKWTPSGGHR